MHKTVERHRKQNGELQKQVEELRQLVGERDAEVQDLAYKDLLPDQILRAQHALQALQDYLIEQHMRRQLLGSEPLQAILGVICQKEQLQQQRKQQNDNRRFVVATTTVLACLLYSDYLSFTHCVHYVAISCSASTGSVQLLGVETGRETTVGVQLQLPSRQLLPELLQSTLESYYNMTTATKRKRSLMWRRSRLLQVLLQLYLHYVHHLQTLARRQALPH